MRLEHAQYGHRRRHITVPSRRINAESIFSITDHKIRLYILQMAGKKLLETMYNVPVQLFYRFCFSCNCNLLPLTRAPVLLIDNRNDKWRGIYCRRYWILCRKTPCRRIELFYFKLYPPHYVQSLAENIRLRRSVACLQICCRQAINLKKTDLRVRAGTLVSTFCRSGDQLSQTSLYWCIIELS